MTKEELESLFNDYYFEDSEEVNETSEDSTEMDPFECFELMHKQDGNSNAGG